MERQQLTAEMLVGWIQQFTPLDQPIVVQEEMGGEGALNIIRVVFDSQKKRFVLVVDNNGL